MERFRVEIVPFAPREEQHVGNESVLCPVCRGVLPASGKDSYTPLRGRLIVTNGYCAGGCAERGADVVEEAAVQPVEEALPVVPAAPPVRQQVAGLARGPR
jgi:C4-type Zn-finger protein